MKRIATFTFLMLGIFLMSSDIVSKGFRIGVYHDPVTVENDHANHPDDSLAIRYFSEMKDFGVDYIIGAAFTDQVMMAYEYDKIELY